MPQNEWYVHIQGETFGPISIDVIQILLRQNRLNFADFVWSVGFDRWMRINELHRFATMMPPYPMLQPPAMMAHAAPVEMAPAPAPAPVVQAPAPVMTAPVPTPEPTAPAPVVMPMMTAPQAPVSAPAPQMATAPIWQEFQGVTPAPMQPQPQAQAPTSNPWASMPQQPVATAPPPQATMPQQPMQTMAPPAPTPTPAVTQVAPPTTNVIQMPARPNAPPAAPIAAPVVTTSTDPFHKPPGKAWIRRHQRAKIEATLSAEGFGTYPVVDLSEGGVFVEATANIPVGNSVKVTIESKFFAKGLDLTGLVIREGQSEDGHKGFAIQFTRVNPAHRRAIQEYVKTQLGS